MSYHTLTYTVYDCIHAYTEVDRVRDGEEEREGERER